jgi:hypothetical protein
MIRPAGLAGGQDRLFIYDGSLPVPLHRGHFPDPPQPPQGLFVYVLPDPLHPLHTPLPPHTTQFAISSSFLFSQTLYETSKLYMEHFEFLQTLITLLPRSHLNHIVSPHFAHFAIFSPPFCNCSERYPTVDVYMRQVRQRQLD